MRSRRAIIAAATSLLLEFANILSALIIPKLIIAQYGSEINGLVSSITQFLGYVSLLQAGVGAAFRASLYKPLADENSRKLSAIFKAGETFFKKISYVSLFYIVLLMILYPILAGSDKGTFYVSSLVLVIGISTFSQYFFGFALINLLIADQRIYIYNIIQLISVLMNISMTYLLIKTNQSVQIVKLATSVIFTIRPLILQVYCKKHYRMHRDVIADSDALTQRRNSMAFSIADYIHKNTDVFVLTAIRAFRDISVYSVYAVVNNGLHSFIAIFTNIFQAGFGDMLAKNEQTSLKKAMDAYITLTHFICTAVFSTTMVMIIPFVKLYTREISDIEYSRPLFAMIIISAELLFCLYLPYQSLILADAKFKEAKKGAYIEALTNIVLSVILTIPLGLNGIAIGTFIAMLYRNIDYVIYIRNHIVNIPLRVSIKRYSISIFCIIVNVLLTKILFDNEYTSMIALVISAAICFVVSLAIAFVVNFLMYGKDMKYIMGKFGIHFKKGGL